MVDPDCTFDELGVCAHCQRYDHLLPARVRMGPEHRPAFERRVETVIRHGKGRDFDCVIGVSGGVDSTYVALLAKELGLRPLAVHVDNGWDSELAVSNIHQTLRTLDIDLETRVLDWEEFRDLQRAFMWASTPDGEVPTDHAIQATLWRTADELGVRTVISGMNFHTESTSVASWAYGHSDWRYIKDVHRRHGSVPLRTYPHFGLNYLAKVTLVDRVRTLAILNHVDYDRAAAKKRLEAELSWRDYGGKHFESVYTRFFQGVFLPEKFGIDKRFGHLSDLIRAGQMTRADAVLELKHPTYDRDLQQRDREYVWKKLGMTESDVDTVMRTPPRSYLDYRNNYATVQLMRRTVNLLRRRGLYDL